MSASALPVGLETADWRWSRMSQNAPILAVFVLLYAPGFVWSEEPLFSNVPRISSSFQGEGIDGMQDRNKRPSFTNLLPVYYMNNRQNAYGSAPETFHDFQSDHRREPQVPSYVEQLSQPTRFMTGSAHGTAPSEVDENNLHRTNPAFGESLSNHMITHLAASEQDVPPSLPIFGRGDPLSETPIYVIRPPYPGMANPTMVNLALLPQEQINPEIIRILQSLKLPYHGRAPLVLIAGQYPPLAWDIQDAESGMELDDSSEVRHKPVMDMIPPNTLSDNEWYDEEIMKHETSIHGRRPPIFPNIGRFAQILPHFIAKPRFSPSNYWLSNPNDPQNIVSTNTEHFEMPNGRNLPSDFLPSEQNNRPRILMPQDYYPPAMQEPIRETRIPEYPIQQSQFPKGLIPDFQQKRGYISEDDSRIHSSSRQFLPHPYSVVLEPNIDPHSSQKDYYSGPYNQQTPYDVKIPPSSEFLSPYGRAPSNHDLPGVISQMGRMVIPDTPSPYPSMYPGNFSGYPYMIPNQFHPGLQTKYPFIQKAPQVQLKLPSHIYPLDDAKTPDTPERSHITPKFKYPEYPSRATEEIGNYRDSQTEYPSQIPNFPTHGSLPSGNLYHPLSQHPLQYSTNNKQLPIQEQPKPNIHAQVDEYPQFPSASQRVPDYNMSPNRYYPDQEPQAPSDRQAHILYPSLSSPSMKTYDNKNLLRTPEFLSRMDRNNIPEASQDDEIKFPLLSRVGLNPEVTSSQQILVHQPHNPFESSLPDRQAPQDDPQYRPTGTDESNSNNTLELSSGEQPDLSTNEQLPSYPKKGADGDASRRLEAVSDLEKVIIPEKSHHSTQQKYPLYPSSRTVNPSYPNERFPSADHERTTRYPEAGLQKSHKGNKLDSPYDGQITHYPRRLKDDTEPQEEVVTEMVSNGEKFNIPQGDSSIPLQKSVRFPSADYDGQTSDGPQKSHERTNPDFLRNDGQTSHYPLQITEDAQPPLEDSTEIISNTEKFNLQEKGSQINVQKYAQLVSADYDGPIKYRGAGPQKMHHDTVLDFPYDSKITHHLQPLDDTDPQLEHRTEIVSNVKKFSVPEQGRPLPLQKYPYPPSSDIGEQTHYPDATYRQPYRRIHSDSPLDGQVIDYPQENIDDTISGMKLGTEAVPKLETFRIPEIMYPIIKHKYPHGSSSDIIEPANYPHSVEKQPYRKAHSDLQNDQVTDYTIHPDKAQIEPRPNIFPNNEQFSTPDQTYTMPHQKYLRIPSLYRDMPESPGNSPQQSYGDQHPGFPAQNQDSGYSKKFVEGMKPMMTPTPILNMEKFNIPVQPLMLVNQENYPQFGSHRSNSGLYPDFPVLGQIPSSGFTGPPIESSEISTRVPPGFVAELEKMNIFEEPDIIPQERYPQHSLTDNDYTGKYSDRGPDPNTGQKPESPSDEQISGYQTYPYGHEVPRPETGSKIEKIHTPEQSHLNPPEGYPLYPSAYTNEPINQPVSGKQQPYSKYKASDDRIPEYSKLPIESARLPEMVSGVRQFDIPKDSLPFEKHPQYPSISRDTPQMFPDEVMRPSFLEDQPWFPSKGNLSQLHQQQPSTHDGNLPIQPKPAVPLQIGRTYTTKMPLAEQLEGYRHHPSVATADERTGYIDTFPKPQYEPSRQQRLNGNMEIGRIIVPKQQYYTTQQPQWPKDGALPTDYPDEYFTQYPSSLKEPALITDPLTFPKSSSRGAIHKYPGIKQPKFDYQHSNRIPKLPTDALVPNNQAQHVFSPYPSSDGRRIPEITDTVSQIGSFKIPETPDSAMQQTFPQHLPFSGDQLSSDSFPSYLAETPSLTKPETSSGEVEPKKPHPRKEIISPTFEMMANVDRFKIAEEQYFIPLGQNYPQDLSTDGTSIQLDDKSVSGLKLREANDIDMNIDRLTVPGAVSWEPSQRYPQHAPTETRTRSYPETHSPYPIPQLQIKPDHHLPVGGEPNRQSLLRNDDLPPSSSPHRPHQHPPFIYPPKEEPERKYQVYPNGDNNFLHNQIQPLVTVDGERISVLDHPNTLPIHGHHQYPPVGGEPPLQFPNYGSQYPPEKQGPHNQEFNPSIYLADEGYIKKQLQPDIQMGTERFKVTRPPSSSPSDEQLQNLYTTSTTSSTQQPEIDIPNDHMKNVIIRPIGRQVQSLPSLKTFPDSTNIYPSRSLHIPAVKSYSQIEHDKIKQESPSADSGYPSPVIEIPPSMQPNQYQLKHPNFIEPQTYGREQSINPDYPISLQNPGKSSLPHPRAISPHPYTLEDYPVEVHSVESPGEPTFGHPTVHSDGKKGQYYPLGQSNYPHDLISSAKEEPKNLKKPTVYVYPVTRQQEVPKSHVPKVDRNISGLPSSYSPQAHDYGQTPAHSQPDPYGISPHVMQYVLQTTAKPPDGLPGDLSRSIQDQSEVPAMTTPLTDIDHHESDQQSFIGGYMDDTTYKTSIQAKHTTSLYPESSQLGVSPISPDGTMLYQPSAEQIAVSSTLSHPVELPSPPSTTPINYPNPLEPEQVTPNGSVIERLSDQRPASYGGAPQASDYSPQDMPRTEVPNDQASSPERVQTAKESSSSVKTLDYPNSNVEVNEHNPVSSVSSSLPPEEFEKGFHPNGSLTTTDQLSGVGSATDEASIILSTLAPQVVPTEEEQLLPEPSRGATDLTTPFSTLIEPGPSSVPLVTQNTSKGLVPDSKITRIFPVTKPTFYTDNEGQKFVSLKLLNEPISRSPTGDSVPLEMPDASRNPGTTDLEIPIGRYVSDTLPQNTTQPNPMLKGIPISNVQVFDSQAIIKVIESCNCSNLKFLIPILKRPHSAIVVANSEYSGNANN